GRCAGLEGRWKTLVERERDEDRTAVHMMITGTRTMSLRTDAKSDEVSGELDKLTAKFKRQKRAKKSKARARFHFNRTPKATHIHDAKYCPKQVQTSNANNKKKVKGVMER